MPDTPDLDPTVARGQAGLRRNAVGRRAGAVAAALLIVAGGVVLATRDRPDGAGPTSVDTGTSSTSSTAPDTTTVPQTGVSTSTKGIGTMAEAPIPGFSLSTSVWTGTELIVWGRAGNQIAGFDNRAGAAYDPTSDSWRTIARSPLASAGQGGVWTGREMVVGPVVEPGAADAPAVSVRFAAYDPAADSWRLVGDPVPSGRAGGVVGWTGSEVILSVPDYSRVRFSLLDPGTGALRDLPEVPNNADSQSRPFGGTQLVGLGDGRIAAASAANAGTVTVSVFTPSTGRWKTAPDHGIASADDRLLVWTGKEVLLVPTTPSGGSRPVPGFAYDPVAGTWRDLAPAPSADAPATWSRFPAIHGGLFVFNSAGVYDIRSDRWSPSPVLPGPERTEPVLAWTGEQLLIWGGSLDCQRDATGSCILGPDGQLDESGLYPADGFTYRPA